MIRKIKNKIRRRIWQLKKNFPINNVNHTKYNKNCLLSYIKEPFFDSKNANVHQNRWQVKEIARIFGDFGYNVDVIEYNVDKVFLKKKYDFVFDILAKETPVYKDRLNENAKRIIYFTGSETEFANQAELIRIKAAEERRGVKLQPRRQAPPIHKCVEDYDCAVMIGNDYNLATYSKFKLKKPKLIPNTGYDFDFKFDADKKKNNNFLFFGSSGCVHKGLDLLLEVFSEEDFPARLYVCGVFESELDFKAAYEKELYHTKNIKPVGFLDLNSDTFKSLADECSYVIMPSCSEGQAGAITTLMSAGIIPICSKECGFEDDEVINLPDCSMETIRSYVLEYADKPMDWIKEKSKEATLLTKTKYCKAEFTRLMTEAIQAALLSE